MVKYSAGVVDWGEVDDDDEKTVQSEVQGAGDNRGDPASEGMLAGPQDHFRLMAENLPEMLVYDMERRLVFANTAAEKSHRIFDC